MRKTKEVLKWIAEILERKKIPFQITGGLAAKVYGSRRKLADIDIDIPEGKFVDIVPEVGNYIIFGPERFVDSKWDLKLMTLSFKGQKIDICGDKAKILDENSSEWKKIRTNFSDSEIHGIYGMAVPVVKKEALVEYKTLLNRTVDIEDIEAISKRAKIRD